jgi:Xaa-Pro dipeptidase
MESELEMDRREFGLFSLGTVAAATAGVPVPLAPAYAQDSSLPRSIAQLPPDLRGLMTRSFAKFSDAEYARREQLMTRVMGEANVDYVLLVTWQRIGSTTEWITGWPGWTEATTVYKPGERMTMFVEYYNHIPLAQRMARNCDVQWAEDRGTARAIEELKRRGAKRVGVIGPLLVPRYRQLEAAFPTVSLDREYTNLRIYEKSEEEIAWFRIGCALSDAAMSTLVKEAKPGMTENELANLVERGYVPHGGSHIIHFIGSTSMAKPEVYVPLQFHSQRRLAAGDVVFCELSSAFWGYSGQVLRSFTVEAEPTQLYRDLHATAESVFDSITKIIRPGTTAEEMIEATALVEKNGFTTCDDVVHGYGGGYFQPIIGSKSRPAANQPKITLRENMCMVVQPNVITTDKTAGVQTGEMIRVTKTGFETLHTTPRGLLRSSQAI